MREVVTYKRHARVVELSKSVTHYASRSRQEFVDNKNKILLLTYRKLYFSQVWGKQENDSVRHWKILPEPSPEMKKKLWKENSYKCASLNESYGKPTKSSKNLKFLVSHTRCKTKETYLEKITPFVDLSDVSISPLATPTRRHDNTVLVWFVDTGASKETTIEGCDFKYILN